MSAALPVERGVRYLVCWSRMVQIPDGPYSRKYIDVLRHFCVPAVSMRAARDEVAALVWRQAEVDGCDLHGCADFGRPPLNVRICRVDRGVAVAMGRRIRRAAAVHRRLEAERREERSKRERAEKQRQLDALRRELGEAE